MKIQNALHCAKYVSELCDIAHPQALYTAIFSVESFDKIPSRIFLKQHPPSPLKMLAPKYHACFFLGWIELDWAGLGYLGWESCSALAHI